MMKAKSDDALAAFERLTDEDRWKVECLTKVFTASSGSLRGIDAQTFLRLLPFVVATGGQLVEDPADGARRSGRSPKSYRASLKRLAAAGHIEFDGERTVVVDVSEKRVEEGARIAEEVEAEMQREHDRFEFHRRQRGAARLGIFLH